MSFHVPELSRILSGPMGTDASYGNNGAFELESPEPGWRLFAICSDGHDPEVPEADGWEHVSVSARQGRRSRTPSWKEMAYVKRLCWDAEDVVVQYHPRESEYVNCHPNVLHMWRSTTQAFPTPHPMLVGPLESGKAGDAVVAVDRATSERPRAPSSANPAEGGTTP